MVSYLDIRKRIQKLWPDCKNVWLSDNEYEYPHLQDIKNIVSLDHTERLTMRGYKFDCDDFALQLSASVSRWVGEHWAGSPWPFGQAMGHKFRNVKEPHSLNICVLEREIILIEPQTDEIWTATAEEDKPFFIKVP